MTKLKYEDDFVSFQGSYGVSQHWLAKKIPRFFEYRACALSALVNVLFYESSRIRNLYQKKSDAITLLLEVYKKIPPMPWGIGSILFLKGKFLTFAASKGLYFSYHSYKGPFTVEPMAAFIKKAIEEDHPLLLLTWNHPNPELKNHWVTITGLVWENGWWMITSNWGKKKMYSLDEYVKGKSLHRELGYFKKKHVHSTSSDLLV